MPRVALRALVAALSLGSAASPIAAEVVRDLEESSGLARWNLRRGALSVQLIQRLPDQTRAFFQGRGFGAEIADRYARACVFQAIVRNIAEPKPGATEEAGKGSRPTVSIDLARWRVDAGTGPRPLPLERDWQSQWEQAGVAEAARVAFRWALFPTEQTFHPGDYNWGMIAFGPAPGEFLDLDLVWTENGTERRARVPAIACAGDR